MFELSKKRVPVTNVYLIFLLQSTLVYDIIGEGNAITTFRIDDITGRITLSTSLLATEADSYVVSGLL